MKQPLHTTANTQPLLTGAAKTQSAAFVQRRTSRNPFFIPIDGNRVYGLDVMRAVAILYVLVSHADLLHTNTAIKTFNSWLGFDGVSIFFVLSGFLIGGILIRIIEKGDHSIKALFAFWKKRWMRTLPAYFLVLLTLIFLTTYVGHYPILQSSKKFFVFLQNFATPHTVFFQEAWSLSIEEWFYLLVPSLLFMLIGILKFPNQKAILFTAVGIMVLVAGFRYYRFLHVSISSFEAFDQLFRKQVVTRLDSLMFGVTGAYIAFYKKDFWSRAKWHCLIAGISLLLAIKVYSLLTIIDYGLYDCVFSFDVEAFATLLFLPYLSQLKKGEGFMYRLITHISLVSYSLYLINFSLVQGWLLPNTPWFGLTGTAFTVIRYLCFWLFTVAGATLLYNYFEKPIMNLRKTQAKSRD